MTTLLAEIASSIPDNTTRGVTPAILRALLNDIVARITGQGTVALFEDSGAVGDGSTDDTTAVQNAINALPDGGTILAWPGKTYLLTSTVNFIGRTHIKIIGLAYGDCIVPGAAGSDAPHFLWNGTANGTMLYFQSCFNPTISGFNFTSLVAVNRCIRSDLTGTINSSPNGPAPTGNATTGTALIVEDCSFVNPTDNPNWIGVSISETSTTNQENCIVRRCNFQGHSSLGLGLATKLGAMTSGSKTLTTTDTPFSSGMVGRRVLVTWTIPSTGTTGIFDDIIATYNSPSSIILTTNSAPSTLANLTVHVGKNYGIGIYIGPSQNSKHHKFDENVSGGLQASIVIAGGSFSLNHLNGEGNEFDIVYGYTMTNAYGTPDITTATGFITEPCVIKYLESEAGIVGIYGGDRPMQISDCRIDNTNQSGQGFFQLTNATLISNGPITVTPGTNQVLVGRIGGNGAAGQIVSIGNIWGMTPAQVGIATWNGYPAGKSEWHSIDQFEDACMLFINGAIGYYGDLPSHPELGMEKWIYDSTANTFGATIAGGGSYKVKAVYNYAGNWTVSAI